MDFLSHGFDGTGRKPFPIQLQFLDWLGQNWDKARVFGGQLPPGVGKSFIVRTIQRKLKANVVPPSNILVSQYMATYPKVNVLKGQAHYKCQERGLVCADVRELKLKPCNGCEYRKCRKAALAGQATFFNPISLFHLTKDENYEEPAVTVIDEAHSLLSVLTLVSGERFSSRKFRLPENTNMLVVMDWLRQQAAQIQRVHTYHTDKKDNEKSLETMADLVRVQTILQFLEEDAENYVITFAVETHKKVQCRVLNVAPIDPPRSLIDTVIGSGKVVLLSATLSELDAAILADDVLYIDMPSPIPADQRPIYYAPFKKEGDAALAHHIMTIYEAQGKPNTIVHVSYALSARLAKYFDGHLVNTKDNKDVMVARFKEQGGLFLAAGCAEGLDLPDDQCRLNIIPVLPRPNPTDAVVKKWLARPGGQKRYDMETLKTLQQQVGRSTRHTADKSMTVVCDQRFPRLIGSNEKQISKSFKDSIIWKVPK